MTKEFMNSLFNILNEITTELFVIFKELKNKYSADILKKTKTYFQVTIDLCRIIEIITLWAPEILLEKD